MSQGHSSAARRAKQKLLFGAASIIVKIVTAAALQYTTPLFNKTPYHTSILTGEGWVHELMTGHPDRIKTELGMWLHVFKHLIFTLRSQGLQRSKHLSLEEQVAIFLYTCVMGLSVQHVGEHFQHSNETISLYVKRSLLLGLVLNSQKLFSQNSTSLIKAAILHIICPPPLS